MAHTAAPLQQRVLVHVHRATTSNNSKGVPQVALLSLRLARVHGMLLACSVLVVCCWTSEQLQADEGLRPVDHRAPKQAGL